MSSLLARASVGLLLATQPACSGASGESPGQDDAAAPAVEVVLAREGTLPLEERLNGVVRAENQFTVRPEIEASVAEVAVRSGDAVRQGQVLVRLDDRELRDQLRQAEASVRLEAAAAKASRARVAELQAQVRRTRELAEQALISRLELETQEAQLAAVEASADQADARVDQVRATLGERRSAVEKSVIRAPYAGRIGRRNAEVGMIVSPATALFELGNLDAVQVEVPLTGEMLRHIKTGMPVLIHSAALGRQPLPARLSRISPFLAAGTFSTTGEIDVANPAGLLRPGMFVSVDVLYGESERATLVPTSAVWEDPRTGVRGVYVIAAGAAQPGPVGQLSSQAFAAALRPIELRAEGRASVGVGGVAAGEWVVVVGQHLLRADGGAKARVRQTSWERVLGLQALQREDLLRGFLEKQREIARTRGAVPPSNEEFAKGAAAPPARGTR